MSYPNHVLLAWLCFGCLVALIGYETVVTARAPASPAIGGVLTVGGVGTSLWPLTRLS